MRLEALPGPRSRGAQASVVAVVVLVAGLLAVVYVLIGDDHSDIGGYHKYALGFLNPAGAVRHLPQEYPPLSLVPFSITLLPVGTDFGVVFVFAMLALFLVSWAVIARTSSGSAANAYAAYMVIAGPWILFGRYDLVPSLVVLGAIAAAGIGRWRTAFALLGLGTLLKLYPLFLLPLFAIEHWRAVRPGEPGIRGLTRMAVAPGVFGLVVAIGLGCAATFDPSGWTSPIRYAVGRPVQAESVPATAIWLMSGLGFPGRLEYSFGSVNVISSGSGFLSAASLLVVAAGCVAVYIRQARGRLTLRGACLACLLVVVATSRVLSPQYLIWLLPLVALEVGLEPLWIGICILTFLIYPILYGLTGMSDSQQATAFATAFLLTVAARNGLLLVAAWRAVRGPLAARAAAGA